MAVFPELDLARPPFCKQCRGRDEVHIKIRPSSPGLRMAFPYPSTPFGSIEISEAALRKMPRPPPYVCRIWAFECEKPWQGRLPKVFAPTRSVPGRASFNRTAPHAKPIPESVAPSSRRKKCAGPPPAHNREKPHKKAKSYAGAFLCAGRLKPGRARNPCAVCPRWSRAG